MDNITKELHDEYGIEAAKYYSAGHSCAINSAMTNPENITDGLDVALGLYRNDAVKITEQRVKKLESDIEQLNTQKGEYEIELQTLNSKLSEKERKKEELITKKDNLEKNAGITSSLAPLIVLGISLVLLTSLVFAFYYYVGRATIIPMLSETLGIMQSIKPLSILFPFFALAVGVTIHFLCISPMMQANTVFKKTKYVLLLLFVLGLAFGLDVVMGTEMSEQAYIKDYNAGRTSIQWKDSMAWSDIHFYIVLILGFAGYVIWGLILSKFLSHPNFNKPEEIEKLKEKISEITEEIANINNQINEKNNKIENLKNEIKAKEQEKNNYKNGGSRYYDEMIFKGIIGVYMNGYKAYVSSIFPDGNDRKATEIIDKASKKKDEWFNNKIKILLSQEA